MMSVCPPMGFLDMGIIITNLEVTPIILNLYPFLGPEVIHEVNDRLHTVYHVVTTRSR